MSWVGIGLAVGSVILMPILAIAKERLADQLGSAATKGEGRQNMLCAYLAGALLVGLLGNALLGAWWLNPVVGLPAAAVAVAARLGGGGAVASAPRSTPASPRIARTTAATSRRSIYRRYRARGVSPVRAALLRRSARARPPWRTSGRGQETRPARSPRGGQRQSWRGRPGKMSGSAARSVEFEYEIGTRLVACALPC